jgi:aryl-alcohol dehydrogenase-like predicted oxidoreductase
MRLTFEPELHEESLAKLGFGTWGLGGNAYGSVSEEHAGALISYAYSSGIRTFDTSPLYGDGRSEGILGKALANVARDTYKLITKGGLYDSGNQELRDFSDIVLNDSLVASLLRLRTDYIDYFLLHSPTADEIANGKINQYGLSSEITNGVIRNFGVSLKSPTDYPLVDDLKSMRAIEFNYSLMDQRAGFLGEGDSGASGLFKIARTPFNFGFLTDTPPEKSPPTSPLDHLKNWSQQQFDVWHASREIWALIAQSNMLSLQDLALTFDLSSNFVDLVIPGFMKAEHIDSALATAKRGPLTKASRDYLIEIYLDNEAKFVVTR